MQLKSKKKGSTGRELTATAKNKEVVRKKLAIVARKLAATVQEREIVSKKLEEAEAIDEAILSSITEGFVAVNKLGQVISISKETERMLGWSVDVLKGKIFNHFVTVLDEKGQVVPQEKRPLYLALTTGKKIVTLGNSYVRKDGTSFATYSYAAPIFLKGEIIGSINNFQDVTKEKKLDKAKDEFISLAAHQLKNPIASIAWTVESLLDGTHGAQNEKQKEVLGRILESSKNMKELIDGFLDITKIEFGGFAVEKGDVDLLEISDSVLEELASQISFKKTNVVRKYGTNIPHINIGTKAASVIFLNLISNAVKYTPEGGTVEIRIEKTAKGISISVKDNGYGIAEEDKAKIFTKLFRADNIKEKEPSGTGLGLYLLKNLVGKLGGEIWFESKEGAGTTFYVNLGYK